MKMKEESEKVGLKLNIPKTKIMASGPITSWQINRETMETVRDFIVLAKTDCMLVHEIKLEKFVVQSFNRVQLFATSWTPAGKAQTHIHGVGDVILPFHHEKFKITEIMTVLMIHSPQMN